MQCRTTVMVQRRPIVDQNGGTVKRAFFSELGVMGWLRPEYQQPRAGIEPVQPALVEGPPGAGGGAGSVWRGGRVRGAAQRGEGGGALCEGGEQARGGVTGNVGAAGAGCGDWGEVWRGVTGWQDDR